MEQNIPIAICIVALFIVILIYHTTSNAGIIPGFWLASDDFKEQANLDQLVMYFNEGSGYNYDGYIIISADGGTVFNDKMSFRITPTCSNKRFMMVMKTDITHMPQRLEMTICPQNGYMELKSPKDSKVYARLYKNNQMSAKTAIA
jgi:hypothetical protein